MTDGGTEDKILDEYLRIINNKDSEIHRLLEEYESLKSASLKQLSALKDREDDLARRLADKSKEAKQLRAQGAKDATSIEQLVENVEALKDRLQRTEAACAAGHARVTELEAARESSEDRHRADAHAAQAEHDALAAAVRAAEERCSALTAALQAATDEARRLTAEGEAREATLARLRETHMPRETHEAAQHALTAQLESAKAAHAARVTALEKALAEARDSAEEKVRAVARLTQQQAENAVEDARLRTAAAEAKRALHEQGQAHQHQEESLRREVAQWKHAASETGDRLAEANRERLAKEAALKHVSEAAQETRVEAERLRAASDKTEEHLRAQLKTSQAQCQQLTEEAERCRRQHDTKEAALKEATIALSASKDDAARQLSDLKEKLATSTAAATSAHADNTRLQHEQQQLQQQLIEAQRRLDHEVNALQRRLAEAEVASQRAQEQHRDQAEALRLATVKHQQELAEQKHATDDTVQRVRQHREAELQDAQARLERYRAELSDGAGGHKSLARELELCADTHRQLKDLVAQHQQAVREAEAQSQALHREKLALQQQLAAQEQAVAVQKKETEQARSQAEAALRAAEDHKASQQRAAQALADAEARVRAATSELATTADHLHTKETTLQQLRREVEQHLAGEHQAKKDAASAALERDQLAQRLVQAEAQRQHAQDATAAAQREHTSADARIEDLTAALQRAQAALEKKTAECRRATAHAEEVEALARKTAEALQGAVEERDATIAGLRRDQGTAFPQLQEERTRNLVLQERLQHQAELANAQQTGLRERVAELEAALLGRQRELEAALSAKEAAVRDLADVVGQIEEMERTTDAHEKTHEHDQHGLRRAEEELARYKTEVRATMAHMEDEVAAAHDIRDRYKKERAKMDQLATQLEERVAAAEKAERASRQREAALTQALEARDEALAQANEELHHRLSELKTAQQERSQQQERTYQEALQEAATAEQTATALRMQLLEAQTALVAAQQAAREAGHRCTTLQARAAEAFATSALDAKEALVDALLGMHRGVLLQGGRRLQEGLMSAQRSQHEAAARVREVEQRTARQLAAVDGDRETAVASAELACQQELARVAQHHREALARAVQAEAENAEKLRGQLREVQRALGGERDARQELATELELCRVDRDHHAKRAADLERACRAGEQRVRQAADELASLQADSEQVRRRWQDAQVERRHDEEELRELRAELAALQTVMAEKEAQLLAEREEARATGARLVQSQDARDTLKELNHDLKEELERLRQQLATAEAAQRRGETTAREGQHATEERLAALQADLASAKSESRRLEHRVEVQDTRAAALTQELDELRRREGDLIKQVQARKGEISALRERCANLESLKNISDASVAEMQSRERDLLEKLEELRNAQQLMQLCFDKQQEQLEIGRRMRDRDVLL